MVLDQVMRLVRRDGEQALAGRTSPDPDSPTALRDVLRRAAERGAVHIDNVDATALALLNLARNTMRDVHVPGSPVWSQRLPKTIGRLIGADLWIEADRQRPE